MTAAIVILLTLLATGNSLRFGNGVKISGKNFGDVPGKAYFMKPDDVCYGDLGCFSMDPPWYTRNRPLPAPYSPEQIHTRFYLYTSNKPDRFYLSTSDTEFNAEGSGFDGSKQTYFITHGWVSHGNLTWLSDMKDAILEHLDANVILVDWGVGAQVRSYHQGASNTRVVGATLVKLGNYLINQWGADPSRFNVIGHSLGAQISSYMCKGLPGVAMFYALDPAQPAFETFDKLVHVDKSDANFVQVIHTDCRPFVPEGGLGMIHPQGHVDFYMNSGRDQPGCNEAPQPAGKSPSDLSKTAKEAVAHLAACSHELAHEYLTASFLLGDDCTFWGHRIQESESVASCLSKGPGTKKSTPVKECDSADNCSPLGSKAVRYPARGVFQVVTSAEKPFCIPDPISDEKMSKFRASK